MKAILLAVLLLSSTAIQAQHFSLGVRSGIGIWKGENFDNEIIEYKEQQTTVWEKEAFVRFEAGKHFAYELGVSTVEGERDGVVGGLCGVGLPQNYTYTSSIKIRDQYHSMNFRVQYGISCSKIKGLTNYPGVVIAPSVCNTRTTYLMYNTGTQDYFNDTYTRKEIVMQYGVEDMVRYQIGNHLDVHTIIACRFNNGGYSLKHAFTAQAGVAYRF